MENFKEVYDLLQSWDLPEATISAIIGGGFTTLKKLTSLSPEFLIDLHIEDVLSRAVYKSEWAKWKDSLVTVKNSPNENSGGSFVTNDVSSMDIHVIEELEKALSSPDCEFKDEVDAHQSRSQPKSLDSSLASEVDPSHPLKKLLSTDPHGRALLEKKLRFLTESCDWHLVSHKIVDHLMRNSPNPPYLKYTDFIPWASYICEIFPDEDPAYWFYVSSGRRADLSTSVGSRTKPNSSSRAGGRLWQRYNNQLQAKRKLGVIQIKKRRSSRNSDSPSQDSYPESNNLDNSKASLEELKAELHTCEFIETITKYKDAESSAFFLSAWRKTHDLRTRYMKSLKSVEEYLDYFPVLRNPAIGPQLVSIDFKLLKPNAVQDSAVYRGLLQYETGIFVEANKAISLLKSKERSALNSLLQSAKSDSITERLTSALLLLPFVLPGGQVQEGRRATKYDAASTFVFLASSRFEVEAEIEKRKELLRAKKRLGAERLQGLQPFVVALGDSWTTVTDVYVYIVFYTTASQ